MVKIDIDMPESCVLCPFSAYDEEYVLCPYGYGKVIEKYEDAITKRADWCPLIEDEDDRK